MNNRKLLCCDWGTSNFRLSLVNISTTEILGEVKAKKGIAVIFDEWQKNKEIDRIDFFRNFLQNKIKRLGEEIGTSINNVPVILSGMSSSSIGMKEIPYAEIPFSIDHPKLSFKHFPASTNFPNELFLYGGLKTKQDVMRGEEVQLLGLSHIMDMGSCVCILPGTHSKHIWIKNKTVTDFQTFMTGECFQLISNQSILKGSLNKNKQFDSSSITHFQKGVRTAQNTNFLNSLFGVRTNTLLKGISNGNNYYYLSGLLIGQELKSLSNFQGQLLLNCSNELAVFYKLALETLQLDKYLTIISEQDIKQCIPIAHLKLYQEQS